MPDATALNIWSIEYSGPLVKIDKHNLPDLDALMLDVLADPETHSMVGDLWLLDDATTRVPGAPAGEGQVGYYRKNPCACGDGHTFDMGFVGMDDEGNPVGKAARGAFLGVYFQ